MITHLYKSGKKVLRRMPFLPQPSPFIRAWDRHQETQKCATDGWLTTVAITKKQVEEMEVAEMKMLRFAMGVTRKDKIRNEHIRSTVKVERLGMKIREGRLRWYGHVIPGVCRKKDDGNGVTRKEEKRETKEKIFRCSKRRYGGSWCEGDGH